MDLDQAKEMVRKAEEEKQKKCAEEINEVLKKYGYILKYSEPKAIFIPVSE